MTDVATPAIRPVPLARPDIGPLEEELVLQVLRSGTLALGPFAEELEREVAAIAGRRHGVAVSNGTVALHTAMAAFGIGPGDEVITTPFSFVASANCILYQGGQPVFVDIEEETLGLDPAAVEAAVTPATRAILPVDVFGHPCRLQELDEVARRHRLSLVEDACEALGSSIDGRPAGSFGQLAAFAFYPNKQITTGEGGMLVTDDDELADVLRSLRNQGRDTNGTWLRHVRLGYNYRLDEMSAALGVAQLRRRQELAAGRARIAAAYRERLGGAAWLTLPAVAEGAQVDWFVYVVRLREGIDRDRLIGELAEAGIPSRPYFSPIHLQPMYRERFGFSPGTFPVTEQVAASTLALPFASTLADADVARVCDALASAVQAQGAE
ncbi:MAG TPA: DegT/DnrJ/EryC1/StrS family aminotransferase [Candidatus Limnocylindria bacterium]|nr:DegT/DnrJ/EryC1/StrS family aminotransferase [Candidatus Limnocylindria bacterium]